MTGTFLCNVSCDSIFACLHSNQKNGRVYAPKRTEVLSEKLLTIGQKETGGRRRHYTLGRSRRSLGILKGFAEYKKVNIHIYVDHYKRELKVTEKFPL